MTNNPTIDGVSRATVENAIEALTRHLSGHAPMQVPPSKSDSDMVREELRALLDADKVNNRQLGIMQFVEAHPIAPAVERQEPDSNSWRLNPEIRCAQCVGHGTYLDGEQCGTCSGSGLKSGATLQSTIARLEAQLNNAINLDFQRRERITQLESEKEFAAATHQAARDRIDELESGRGDDWLSLAHEFQAVGLKYWDAHQRERGDGAVKFLHNDETGATFVVTRGEYAQELKDFIFSLDATAALNGPAK